MAAAELPTPNLRKAVLLTLVSCVAFGSMWGLIRLATQQLDSFQVVFGRNLFGLLWMIPWLAFTGGFAIRAGQIKGHLQRATSGVIATFSVFYAVAHAPLATAMAINYAAPLFATIAAVLLLGERIRARRIAALTAGVLGMLLVIRPGSLPLTPGVIAAMISAIATAFTIITIKRMTATEEMRAIALPICPSGSA